MARLAIASQRLSFESRIFPCVGWLFAFTSSWRSVMLWSAFAQSSSAFFWASSRFCGWVVWINSDESLLILCCFFILLCCLVSKHIVPVFSSHWEWIIFVWMTRLGSWVRDHDVAWTVPASFWQSVFHHTQSGPYDETMGCQECAQVPANPGMTKEPLWRHKTLTCTNIRNIVQIVS